MIADIEAQRLSFRNVRWKAEVTVKLNQDFGIAGMSSADLQAVVGAWRSGAISRDTMFELFRSWGDFAGWTY
jgi:hypothetical protein